jgi:Mn2+/Fe2+ NRAMP family transporter
MFFNPAIGTFVLLAGITIVMWVVIYLLFSLHAMLWRQQSLTQALRYSIRFIQAFLPTALLLIIICVTALGVMRWLWAAADNGSWLTLVSIFGHAFISTAMVMATFVYFRDREPFFTRYLSQSAAQRGPNRPI